MTCSGDWAATKKPPKGGFCRGSTCLWALDRLDLELVHLRHRAGRDRATVGRPFRVATVPSIGRADADVHRRRARHAEGDRRDEPGAAEVLDARPVDAA